MAEWNTTRLALTQQNIDWLKHKLAIGQYKSEEDVINEGLNLLRHADFVAQYEREIVGPAYDQYMAAPSSAISMEEMEREFCLPDQLEC